MSAGKFTEALDRAVRNTTPAWAKSERDWEIARLDALIRDPFLPAEERLIAQSQLLNLRDFCSIKGANDL